MFGKLGRIALAGLLLAAGPVSASWAREDRTYAKLHAAEPAIAPGMGRIYFYRTGMLGGLIQPAIRLNGEKVGDSVPDDYFYVDRPAGAYQVVTSTEKTETTPLTLQAGQSVYVRMKPSLGLFVYHMIPIVQATAVAEAEIKDCDYDPSPVILPVAPATPAEPAATPPAPTAPAAPTTPPASTTPPGQN